jgi:hypothetical protein
MTMHDSAEIRSLSGKDAAETRGLEETARRTKAGREFLKCRGLNFTGGAFDAPAPAATPTPKPTPAAPAPLPIMGELPLIDPDRVSVVGQRSPYGPDSPHSWFRDLARLKAAELEQDRLISAGFRSGTLGESLIGPNGDGGLEEVKRRLSAAGREARDVTLASGGAGMATTQLIASMFDTAARAEGKLADPELVELVELTGRASAIRVPRWSTGSAVAVEEENATVQNTDPASANVESTGTLLAGAVEVTWQALERSAGAIDAAISRDLGADMARALDVQVLTGSGSNGEQTGLLNLSGTTSTTWTEGSPTAAGLMGKLWAAASASEEASGLAPEVVLLHPRHAAFIYSGLSSTSRVSLEENLPGRVVSVGSMPSTLGAGTNQAAAVLYPRRAVMLVLGRVEFRAHMDTSLSGLLTARLTAHRFVHVLVRRPSAVSKLTGTGMVLPTL